MSKPQSEPVPLAPNGFPWRAALIGAAVIGIGTLGGALAFPGAALGGVFLVSALVGLAAFSLSLG